MRREIKQWIIDMSDDEIPVRRDTKSIADALIAAKGHCNLHIHQTEITGLSHRKLLDEFGVLYEKAISRFERRHMTLPPPDEDGYYLLDAYDVALNIVKGYARYKPRREGFSCETGFRFRILERRFLILDVYPEFNDVESRVERLEESVYVRGYLFSTFQSTQIGEFSEKIVVVDGEYYLYSEGKQKLLDALSELELQNE